LSPERMHFLSGPPSLSVGLRRSLGSVRIGGLPVVARARFILEPVRARSHDDFVALLIGQAIFAEHAALVLLASVAALPSGAAAQAGAESKRPAATAWESLPGVVTEGKTVVVRTRDGQTAKGRVRSLSDTAIVIESGRLLTIAAVDVETIEGDRAGRQVRRGVVQGLKVGAALGGLIAGSWLLFQPHDGPCTTDDCLTGRDALIAMVAFPAVGAAIGAGAGLRPGERRMLYARGEHGSMAIAPIVGRGRRGAQLRVAF